MSLENRKGDKCINAGFGVMNAGIFRIIVKSTAENADNFTEKFGK